MTEIYLQVGETKIPFLSVPDRDVRRLAVRPFKWLRHMMFCICGARGELHVMSTGRLVDYGSTSLADEVYLYKPKDSFIFVDPHGLNDQMTTSTLTQRRRDFRDDVVERDGQFCVVTEATEDLCDAAHIVPKAKGHEYILAVVRDRSVRYDSSLSHISGINDIENGILLAKTLHAMHSKGLVAFIKVRSLCSLDLGMFKLSQFLDSEFWLEPNDIVRLDRGSTLTDHITLQHLKPHTPADFDPAHLGLPLPVDALFMLGANVDILFQGTGNSPPSIVILDYMYGVAAFNAWGKETSSILLQRYYESHYKSLLPAPNPQSGDDSDGSNCDGDDDADCYPDASQQHYSTRKGTEMARVMDGLNAVIMYLKGTSPQETAERREKRLEEEEKVAQEASRTKVMEWMRTTEGDGY